jgi:hypothetical protein
MHSQTQHNWTHGGPEARWERDRISFTFRQIA